MRFKRGVILAAAVLLVVTIATSCGKGKEQIEGNFTYRTNEEGGVTLTDYNGLSGNGCVEVPENLGGRPVTAIGSFCFSNTESLKAISLPPTVQLIENRAFQNCENLESVHLNEGLKYLDFSVFRGCVNLKAIHLPDSLEAIEYSAFEDCTALLDITGGEGLQMIEDKSVFANTAWADVQDGDILMLGGIVFGLKGDPEGVLILPEDTRSVMDDVFWGANAVTAVVFPADIISLGNRAFSSMAALERVIFQGGEQLQKVGDSLFEDCPELRYADLTGVKNIGRRMFAECGNLETVAAEDARSVGSMAFSECSQLTAFDFSRVQHVGDYAFSESGLTQITIPAGVELDEKVFYSCKALTDATVASDVPWAAFSGCSNLSCVTLADGCHTVGPRAFGTGKPITVRVGKNVERISSNAFGEIGKEREFHLIGAGHGGYAAIYAYNHHGYFTEG